jgi:hypothetical protein
VTQPRRPCVRCGTSINPYTRQEPHRSTHKGRGLCGTCRDYVTTHGDLADYPRVTISRDELLDDYVILRKEGYTHRQIAKRLGMTYVALDRALVRARKAGDPRVSREVMSLVGGRWRFNSPRARGVAA